MNSQLNNKKGSKIKGKIAKSSVTFRKNKPNLSEDKFGAKHFSKRIYERFHPLAGRKNKPNQTQSKAKSNPIPSEAKNEPKSIHNNELQKRNRPQADANKPKQTQFKDNLETAHTCDIYQRNSLSLTPRRPITIMNVTAIMMILPLIEGDSENA